MLPVNPGGHAAYQNFVATNLRKYYPNPDAFSRATWDIIERFWNLDLSYTDELLRSKYSVFGPKPRTPSCMQRSYLLSIDFKIHSLTDWAAQLKINPLYAILSGFEFGDTPGVDTFYDFLSRLWDSSRDRFYFGYDLYMLVAANSESDLPVFPLLNPASKHDSYEFLETWFRMKAFLPDLHVRKWLLDSAHDAMPYYIYCRKNHIQPFIDLNVKRGIKVKYKNDFTIGEDGVPVCKAGRKMHHDGSEPSKEKAEIPLSSGQPEIRLFLHAALLGFQVWQDSPSGYER